MEVLHEDAGDLLGPLLHALDVEVDLGADLVFGELVLFGGVGVGVVGGTAVAAGDDDPLAGLFLDVVEEVEEDGVDVLLAVDDGEAVSAGAFAVGGVGDGASFTAEELFGDAGELDVGFPGVGAAGGVLKGPVGGEGVSVTAVDGLGFAVEAAEFLVFRLLHAGTTEKKEGQ